jgi:hypothetical protein
VASDISPHDLFVPIIAGATINSITARKPHSAAVISGAAIATGAAYCAAIREELNGALFLCP